MSHCSSSVIPYQNRRLLVGTLAMPQHIHIPAYTSIYYIVWYIVRDPPVSGECRWGDRLAVRQADTATHTHTYTLLVWLGE